MSQLGRGYPYLRRRDLVPWGSPWTNLAHRYVLPSGVLGGSDVALYMSGARLSELPLWSPGNNWVLWQFRPNTGTPILIRANLYWRPTENMTFSAFDIEVQRFAVRDRMNDAVVNPGIYSPVFNGFTVRIPASATPNIYWTSGNFRAATYAECAAAGDIPHG
jgi:hypothetical protein